MRPNWFLGFPIRPAPWLPALLAGLPAQVRPFHVEDLHMTLAFLGDVDERAARAAFVEACAALLPVTTITTRAVEPFGKPARPSAFSLTVDEGLDALRAHFTTRQDAILAAAGRPPERRRGGPRPHITVARPTRRASDAAREAAIAWAADATPPEASITLEHLALYTWSATRGDRLFQIVEEVALPVHEA